MSTPILLLGPGKAAGDRSTALMVAPRPKLMPWWAPAGMTLAETEAWYAWAMRERADLFRPLPYRLPKQAEHLRWTLAYWGFP